MKSILNILIVEDQENVSKVIKLVCENSLEDSHNLNLVISYDGVDALQKCQQSKFDLIISDINMPKMTGNEFISKLREDGQSDVPIIVLSAFTDQLNQFDENLVYIMEKPFDIERLESILKMALANRIREVAT